MVVSCRSRIVAYEIEGIGDISTMHRSRLFATSAVAALAASPFAFSPAALAQDEAAEASSDRIIVSTQKREELSSDVPITLTAYDQGTLDLLDVEAFDDLSNFVPGLTVQLQSANNPGFVIRGITSDNGNFQDPPRVSVFLNGVDVSRSRGAAFELFDLERVEVAKGPQATLFGTAASVGAISVITARPQQEQSAGGYVEYGSYNSRKVGGFVTGGNDFFQGRLAAQYRARDGFITNIAGDEGSNALSSQGDLNGIDTFAIRPSLRFTPSDALTIDFIYNYERNQPPGTSFKSGVIAPSGGDTDPNTFAELGGAFGNPMWSFEQIAGVLQGGPIPTPLVFDGSGVLNGFLGDDELGLDRTVEDYNLTVNWDIGDGFLLTAIAGYREFDSLEVFDADGSQVPLFEAAEDSEGEQTNIELRVNFDRGGRFRGFGGVNYFQEEGFQRAPFAFDETIFAACISPQAVDPETGEFIILPSCVNPDGSFNRINPLDGTLAPASALPGIYYPAEFTNFGDHETYSVFADLTFDLTDRIELTGGIRYIDEERTSGQRNVFPDSTLVFAGSLPAVQGGQLPGPLFQPLLAGFANTGDEIISAGVEDDAFLWRANALFRMTDDVNVYGTVSRGRRSPVFSILQTGDAGGRCNIALPPTDPNFNPRCFDQVDDRDLEDPFLPNDILEPSLEVVPEELVTNYEVGLKGDLLGGQLLVDLALFYQLYEDFRVQVTELESGGIQNVSAGEATNLGVESTAQFRPTDNLTLIGTFAYIDAQIDDDPQNGVFAGNQFRLQPEYSGSATADYRFPLFGSVEGFGTLSYVYRSEVFFENDNDPRFAEDDLSLVNLRLGLAEFDGSWEVAVYGNNVFDEDYIIDAGNTGREFGSGTFIAGPPALWGVELRSEF